MAPRKYKSAQDQLDLLADRSKQFELMEEFEFCQTPSQVAMLCKIFVAVGKFNKKTIPIATLARRCSISMQSAYRIKVQLEEMGLIFAKTLGGRRFEWSIGWANVWDMHEEFKQTPAVEEPEMGCSENEESDSVCLTHETGRLMGKTARLTSETRNLTSETTRLTGETHIRSIGSSSFNTSFSSSSTSVEGDDDDVVEALAIRLLNCGVTHVGPAISKARERGMSIEQIHAVIDHYTADENSGRWSANVLVDRLIREHMRLVEPDKSWLGENPEWTAKQKRQAQQVQAQVAHQQSIEATQRTAKPTPEADEAAKLEATYGPMLDAMTGEERRTLRATFTPFMQQCIARFQGEAHKSHYRRMYLEALKSRGTR